MANPQHYTLVAATVKTFDLDAGCNAIEVVNVDGAAAVYFSIDGTAPTVAGDGFHVLPASIGALVVPDSSDRAAPVVKCISSGTPKISARVLNSNQF